MNHRAVLCKVSISSVATVCIVYNPNKHFKLRAQRDAVSVNWKSPGLCSFLFFIIIFFFLAMCC